MTELKIEEFDETPFLELLLHTAPRGKKIKDFLLKKQFI